MNFIGREGRRNGKEKGKMPIPFQQLYQPVIGIVRTQKQIKPIRGTKTIKAGQKDSMYLKTGTFQNGIFARVDFPHDGISVYFSGIYRVYGSGLSLIMFLTASLDTTISKIFVEHES